MTSRTYRPLLKLIVDDVDVHDISSDKRVEERRAEATTTETDHDASAPQTQDRTTTTKPKRKRGDRKGNLYPDKACYVITEVRSAGEILEPKEFRGRFCNAIRALVRDQLNLAIRS